MTYIGKYLGGYKIASTKKSGEYVEVTFDEITHEVGDKKETFTPDSIIVSDEYLSRLTTDDEVKISDFILEESIFIADQLYNVLLKHNVRVGSVDRILERLAYSMNVNSKNKISELFQKDYDDRCLLDITPSK